MAATRLWRLEGVIKHYAWGSRTAIPELCGMPPDGKPQAELWLGAHPNAPSRVLGDGDSITLDEWIAREPEAVLGCRVLEQFGPTLPFLLKVLAAAHPLSIQAHPSAAQARAGFAREESAGVPRDAPNRCYRDPRPKPELVCALSPFHALNRFREPSEIEARVTALGVPDLTALITPLRDSPNRDGLAAFFSNWMTLPHTTRARLTAAAAHEAEGSPDGDPAHAQVVRLARAYPGDSGVLAPLFLNMLELAPDEAMYLPTGELHSYLGGTAIELMANSDNVLRGGLTSKHVCVTELISALSFEFGPVDRVRPQRAESAELQYKTPAAEFELSMLRLDSVRSWESCEERGIEILLCTAGHVQIVNERGHRFELPRGSSMVAPAAAGQYTATGHGTVHRASVAPAGVG